MSVVTIENILKNNGSLNINIPDDYYYSNERRRIIEYAGNIYKSIINYFSNADNYIDQDTSNNIKKNLLEKICSVAYGPYSVLRNNATSLYLKYANNYDNIDNIVKNVLEGNASEDEDWVYSFAYIILYYSLFKYFPATDCLSCGNFYNDDVFKLVPIGTSYGYCFNSDNSVFSLFNKLSGETWPKGNSYYSSGKIFSKRTEIATDRLLIDGYLPLSSGNYILFEESDGEILVKEFILKLIDLNLIPSDTDNNIANSYIINDFTLNIGKGLLSLLAENIKSVIDNVISNLRAKVLNETQKEFTFYNTTITVNSASDDCVKYMEVYKYGVELLRKYIEALKNENKQISSDEYVKKLVEKISGAVNSNNDYILPSNINKKCYIYGDVGGTEILEFISNKLGIQNETDARINNTTLSIKLDLSNLDDGKQEYNLTQFYITSEKSGYLKELANKVNENKEYDKPFYFYEYLIFNNENEIKNYNTSEKLKNIIDKYCLISSNVISKFAFLTVNNLSKNNPSEYIVYNDMTARPDHYSNSKEGITCSSFVAQKKYSSTNEVVKIKGTWYNKWKDVYQEIAKVVIEYLKSIIKDVEESQTIDNDFKSADIESADYESYLKMRTSNGFFTEKDYFYINDNGIKRTPNSVFVDVEFKVPRYENNKIIEEWIPVSSRRNYVNNEIVEDIVINENSGEREMHAGTYFSSFELDDKAGTREITLTLKSVNDLNLERIIFNSLSLESKKFEASNEYNVNLDYMIKNIESNFKIRFGYREEPSENSAITTSDSFNTEFINRVDAQVNNLNGNTNFVKPVEIYPWTYFKITGLNSNIKDGVDTYEIKGVESGSYAFQYLSLSGVSTNFSDKMEENSGTLYGSPRNVIGKIAKWITSASSKTIDDRSSSNSDKKDISTATICFLSDEDGKIITDFDPNAYNKETNGTGAFVSDYSYVLRGGGTLKGGDIKKIESAFFDSTGSTLLNAKNFNISNDYKTYSVKELLNQLCDWLPSRIYYISKIDEGNTKQTAATYLTYETIYRNFKNFFSTMPYKSENIRYQIIDAEAKILKPGETFEMFTEEQKKEEGFWQKVHFIRMYYEGPGKKKYNDNNSYLRIYNYRSTQEQVIENIEISTDDAEYGNTVSSVMLLGGGVPMVFSCDSEGKINNEVRIGNSGENISRDGRQDGGVVDTGTISVLGNSGEENFKPFLFYNNNKFIDSSIKGNDNINTVISNFTEEAARFFTKQQNRLYKGEITITGDPFYYFDSRMEAGVYEILLQMNRVSNRKTYELSPSRYSGIYYINGIRHNIDESGKFTTTLSVIKRIFGEPRKTNEEEQNSLI